MARPKKEEKMAKKSKEEKRGISLKVDDDLYWKFLEWKAKFRVGTNEDCVRKLIEMVEKKG